MFSFDNAGENEISKMYFDLSDDVEHPKMRNTNRHKAKCFMGTLLDGT